MKSWLPVVFALLTGLCWGAYGPTLGFARDADSLKSPFKPYLMIGLAYLVWGIVGGYIGMQVKGHSFNTFNGAQYFWGFAAGTLGAWGALFLTFAIVSGGKPPFVMPIVFGTAVAIQALTVIVLSRANMNVPLMVGMAGMIVSIYLVASNTPHGGPAHKPVAVDAATGDGQAKPSSDKH